MKYHLTALLGALCVALAASAAAGASPQGWFVTQTNNGPECTHHQYESSIAGPFETKEACQALLTPTSGQVCEDGETLTVAYPNLYVEQHEGVTAGACASVIPPPGKPFEPPRDSASFLCYSIGGDQFVADTKTIAQAREADGYWLPTAVPGPGTNEVGPYHLVCETPQAGGPGNAPLAVTYADHNGDVLDFASADSTDWVGVYPIG